MYCKDGQMFVTKESFSAGNFSASTPTPATSMNFTCTVTGRLDPKLSDYTCTKDCEDPSIDWSVMSYSFQTNDDTVVGYSFK